MVLMLRSIHIPARLVTGYSATTYNPITGYYEVFTLDAHAWVEAYIEGEGWVSFEPTNAYALPREKDKTKNTSQELEEYLDTLMKMGKYQRYRGFFEDVYAYVLLTFEAVNKMIFTIGELMAAGVHLAVSFFVHVGIYLLLLALAIFYLWHRYSAFFYQSIAAGEIASCQDIEQYRTIHLSLQKLFAHYESELKAGETPLEYAERLSSEYPEYKNVIQEFYTLVDQKSYQKHIQNMDIQKIKALALKLSKLKKEPQPFIERLRGLL